jgi:predicted nucleic acid-binding protein
LAVYFFDSSAIVKRYVQETGTQWVNGIIDPISGNDIYLARITGVEVVSALVRRKRDGTILAQAVATALEQFHKDFASEYQALDMTAFVLTRAMSLAEAHAVRGYDAVQLAAALEVNGYCLATGLSALTLISADVSLNAAATVEGLKVDNPNNH